MANRTKLTAKKKEAFCQTLAKGDSVTAAAKAIGMARRYMYEVREVDPDFAAGWDAAVEAGTDVLEDEAKRRGLEKSDTLLIFLLKGRRREKYGDKVEHGGEVSHTHKVVRVPAKIKKEEWPTLLRSK